MVETRVYYCSTCGKRINPEDVDAGGMTERDGQVFCAKCAQSTDENPDRIDNVFELGQVLSTLIYPFLRFSSTLRRPRI